MSHASGTAPPVSPSGNAVGMAASGSDGQGCHASPCPSAPMDDLPPNNASDAGDLDLAAPDSLASAGATGTGMGPGDLYDPSEDAGADDDAAALDAGVTDQPSDPLGLNGASDEVLGGLNPDAEDFGPGSGNMGDSNSPSDEL